MQKRVKSNYLVFGFLLFFSVLAHAEENNSKKTVNVELEMREKLRQEARQREEAKLQEDLSRIAKARQQIEESEILLRKSKLKFEDLVTPEVKSSSCLIYTYSIEKEVPPRLVAAVDFHARLLHRLNEIHDLVKVGLVEILDHTPEFSTETYVVSAFAGRKNPYEDAKAFTRVAAHPLKDFNFLQKEKDFKSLPKKNSDLKNYWTWIYLLKGESCLRFNYFDEKYVLKILGHLHLKTGTGLP